jgi:hypothetical protein
MSDAIPRVVTWNKVICISFLQYSKGLEQGREHTGYQLPTITEEGKNMLPENRVATHPGEILIEEFLDPVWITPVAFAQ